MAKRSEANSVLIKKRLLLELPNFKFSVTRDTFSMGESITITILGGNIRPFTDEFKNIQVNLYHYKNDDRITNDMKRVIEKVIEIANSVEKFNRHDTFLHVQIGSYQNGYDYMSGVRTSGGRSANTSKWDWGELITECAGWKLYKKPFKETFVYNLVKDKETPSNREKWNEIRGLITTQEGFKWTPKTQTFSKWGEIKDIKTTYDNLCRILGQYYQGATKNEPTPIPEPTPEPTPSSKLRDITDEEARDFAERMSYVEGDIWGKLDISSGGELRADKVKQVEYVKMMLTALNNRIKLYFPYILTDVNVSSLQKIGLIFQNENHHILNNFLALAGFYGETIKQEYVDLYKKNPSYYLTPFDTKSEEPNIKSDDRESIEKKVKALALVFKYAKTDEEKKVAENKINALKIILKYKK